MMDLPELSECPSLHHDCCTSLSTKFVSRLASILPGSPALTLSIGSGSGLLEALLLNQRCDIRIQGVEVSSSVNSYLAKESICVVNGTWDLCPLAKEAKVWMFCYPKDIGLIGKYAQAFEESSTGFCIWIGPIADFYELEGQISLSTWTMEVIEDCGLSTYEKLVVWRIQKAVSINSRSMER